MSNNVVLVGRVVRQPELTETLDGKKVSTITLAVTRSFKNALTGEYDTDFINITLWEGIAKSVVEYCGKGAIIGVKARLVHRTYEVPNYIQHITSHTAPDQILAGSFTTSTILFLWSGRAVTPSPRH